MFNDVAELSEKIKNLATELKSELGDEFMDKLKKLVQKKVDYLAYAYILCIVLLVVIFGKTFI
jgi:hypothetical protein